MSTRLGFAASIALEFDVYLIDEAFSAGDARFTARCQAAFAQRLENSRVIMVSHATETLLTYCEVGATLHRGRLAYYDDIKEAVLNYNRIVREPRAAD